MTAILISWAVLSVAIWITGIVLSGVNIKTIWDAIVVAAVYGVLNVIIGWVLFVLIGIATLGIGFLLFFITRLVVAAFILMLTDSITDRIEIRGFWWAFLAAAIIAGVSTAAEMLLGKI